MAPLWSLLVPEVLSGRLWKLFLAINQLSFPVGHVEAGNSEAPSHGISLRGLAFWNLFLDKLINQVVRVLHHIVVVDHAIF